MKEFAKTGHKIGFHGYSQDKPITLSHVQERAVLDGSIELVSQLCGKRPTGYAAPWWESSPAYRIVPSDRFTKIFFITINGMAGNSAARALGKDEPPAKKSKKQTISNVTILILIIYSQFSISLYSNI